MKRQYPPPPFDIVGPTGQRVTITAHSARDTVGDLSCALGLSRQQSLAIDGQPVANHQLLVGSGIRAASKITATGNGGDPVDHAVVECELVARVEVIVTGGPDCNVAVPLLRGRHLIGRAATASVCIADPLIELHHGVLEVLPDRSVTFAQLTGRVPALIDGSPCTGIVSVPLNSELRIGSTSLRVRELDVSASDSRGNDEGSISSTTSDPWRRVVHRGPNSPAPPDEEQLVVPDPPQQHPAPPATGLVGAGIAVIGAGVVALLLGQMMFALFAMIGAVASVGTWAVGSVGAFRRRRRARAASADADAVFVANLRAARDRALARHRVEHPFLEESLQIASSLAVAATTRSRVWQHRVADGAGGLSAVLGRGTQRWQQHLETPAERDLPHDLALEIEQASKLSDVAVPLAFPADSAVAFRGDSDQVCALVRSLVVQLATRSGPADWRIVVVTRAPAAWRWVGWLAHARTRGGEQLVIDAADGESLTRLLDEVQQTADRPILLIADDPAMFATRTGALRRFIDTAGPSTMAIVDTDATVPAMCRRVLTIGSTGGAAWSGHLDHRDTAIDIRVSGISIETAEAVTRRLAALVDPEDGRDSGSTLPSVLSLTDIDDVTLGAFGDRDAERRAATSAIVRRWNAAGQDPSPRAPIGRSVDGAVELDLVRDGPHGLIAGTTGSGKSELLRTMVVSLASQLSPDHLTFVLVDYKGGATFDACARLPHTVGVVTDLDAGLAERALISLEAELHRREELLRMVGATDLSDYRSHCDSEVMPRLVVVIDEFAALAKELPDFLAALVGIAQRGRSLGIHLILATQRPAGVVTDDIRANTNLRIALRLNDVADAHDVVGDDQPAEFGRGSPGRAALRLGPDELVVFQAARCTGAATVQSGRLRAQQPTSSSDATDDPGDGGPSSALPTSELEVAVALIADAATLAEIAVPHRPWIESLPATLSHEVVADVVRRVADDDVCDAVGVVDEPTAQAQVPLRWDYRGGHLALIGSLGSGRTSTLIAVLAARCQAASPESLHCYVIDARGDAGLDGLTGIAHCGGVVRVQELERLHRVLARLVAEIDDRASGIGQDDWTDVVLAIDGLASLRTALSSIDMAPSLALLDRVLADGPPAGVVCCWTADGSSANSASMPAAESWVFHLDDPSLARSLAGGSVAIPPDVPGRLRIASSGLDAQVAVGAAGVAELPDRSTGRGPAAVEVLPKSLSCKVLADAASASASIGGPAPIDASAGLELPMGLAADDLAVAALHLPQLDHIFIGGAALTGKTTALAQVANAWRQVNPSGTTVVVDRRRPLTTDRLAEWHGAPVLVLVDDAERIEDEGGLLAVILAAGDPNVTVAAAARLDAVRSSYGHWARDVARSRCGIILTSAGDVDGDLLGVTLPRRSLIAPRPGLGWLIDSRGQRLIQIAT